MINAFHSSADFSAMMMLWFCCCFIFTASCFFFSPFETWSHVLISDSLNDITLYIFYYEICSCFFIIIFKFDNYYIIWSTVCSSGENFILGMDFLKMRLMGVQTHMVCIYKLNIFIYVCMYAYIYVLCLLNSVLYSTYEKIPDIPIVTPLVTLNMVVPAANIV